MSQIRKRTLSSSVRFLLHGKSKTMTMNTNESSGNCSDTDVFTTYDLGLSTALLTVGYKLQNLDRSNGRRVLFVFEHKAGIEIASNRFFSDELKVKARSYFDNLKAIKTKLYSDERA